MIKLLLLFALVLPCYGTKCPVTKPHPRGIGATLNSIVSGEAQQARMVGAK